ncbi:MAG: alpha-N-acetylglucosaminidase C-terminal domain-containing protein [Planctomycetes bacterium]|nr:alpha-N-acetylglucosaminidase C-terminal domain-containing protein [Planctomycetota bacterium]
MRAHARIAACIGIFSIAVATTPAPAAAGAAGMAAEIVLIDEGRAQVDILLAPSPEPAERHAAAEMRRILSAMTGGTPVASGGARILLGRAAAHPAIQDALGGDGQSEPLTGDAFRIRTAPGLSGGDLLVLAGGSGRACIYAVHEFFTRFAGAGLFADGERIPRLDRLAIGPVDLEMRPAFALRQLFTPEHAPIFAEYWDDELWRVILDVATRIRWNRVYLRGAEEWLLDLALARAFPARFPSGPSAAAGLGIERARKIARLAGDRGIDLVVSAFDGRLPQTLEGGASPSPETIAAVGRAWANAVSDAFAGAACAGTVLDLRRAGRLSDDAPIAAALIESAGPSLRLVVPPEGSGGAFSDLPAKGPPGVAILDASPRGDGSPWALRIGPLPSLMAGDLEGLERSTAEARGDPLCDAIVLETSSLVHNPLFVQAIADAAFGAAGGEGGLDAFVERRYGRSDLLAMAWQVAAKALHGPAQPPVPFLQIRPCLEVATRARENLYRIQPLAFALELALSAEDDLAGNPFYALDVVGLAREYLIARCALWWVRVEEAAEAEDVAALRDARRQLDTTLDDLEDVLAALPAFSTARVAASASARSDLPDGARRLREHLVCPGGLARYPEDLDRDGAVLYEVVHAYYRPRLWAYLDLLERSVSERTILDPDRLAAACRRVTERFVDGEDWPRRRDPGDPIAVVRDVFKRQRHLPRPVIRPSADAIANGGFEEGFGNPWRIYWNGEVQIHPEEKEPGEGRRAFGFRIDPSPGEPRDLEAIVRVRPGGPFRVRALARLDEVTKGASASCRVEGFDASGIKRAQVVIHWGGENWDYGAETPDRTGGFYAMKRGVEVPLGSWTEISFDPEEELDRIHGPGTWRAMAIDYVAISLRAWILERDDNAIAGAFDGVRIDPAER